MSIESRLPNWLRRRAADMPNAPALIVGERHWSYAELGAAVDALATTLAARGIGAGDRVAVLLRNGTHFVSVVHALIRLRAVLLPLNVRLTAPELAWQLEHAGARLLIHDHQTAAPAQAAAAPLSTLHTLLIEPPGTADRMPYAVRDDGNMQAGTATARSEHLSDYIALEAIQCIMYTSGTTGRPKGVMLSYGNHWWGAIGSALNLGLRAEDRWLACLPLFHIGGLSILLRSAIYGIPVVLPDPAGASFEPVLINRTIAEAGVTIISVVSAQLQRMLEAGLAGAESGGTLRCVLLGGGPAPRPVLEECARRGIPVSQSYGLTETCSQVATLAPADALRKLGSAGRPLLPTEVRIARALQERAEPGIDEDALLAGEILVRGPTVSPGYLAPDGAAVPQPAVDAEGWLHTGDIGYLDGEGYLYVLDRRTDLIISGGENVYPAEVEAALLAHAAVRDAGVYGIPDPRWGQIVAAAVVLHPGVTVDEAELIAFAAERLARYKVPARITLREQLPRNAAGKLLRRALHSTDEQG